MFAPIDVEEATIRALPARPPKPMYTSFGGMNLHTYETYEVRDNLVAVEYSSGTINLTGAEARQFLRMLGDRRAAQFN
ncbi:MAG: hypothetical protein SFU83_19535 [Meiothermus sp.]|nr:hypothetical protein [Meiothermus sp.]